MRPGEIDNSKYCRKNAWREKADHKIVEQVTASRGMSRAISQMQSMLINGMVTGGRLLQEWQLDGYLQL